MERVGPGALSTSNSSEPLTQPQVHTEAGNGPSASAATQVLRLVAFVVLVAVVAVHTDTTTVKRSTALTVPVAFGRHRQPPKGRARPTCILAPGLEAARDPPRRDGLQDAAWEHGVWTAQPFLVICSLSLSVATRPPVPSLYTTLHHDVQRCHPAPRSAGGTRSLSAEGDFWVLVICESLCACWTH